MIKKLLLTITGLAIATSYGHVHADELQTASLSNPQIRVACSAGAEGPVERTFILKADDERPNYFHTGNGPDPFYATVFESNLVRAEALVVIYRDSGKHFLDLASVRYFPLQTNGATASGGIYLPQHNLEVRRNSQIHVLAERDGDLGGFLSNALCTVSLAPTVSRAIP